MADIVTLPTISRNFPTFPDPLIDRSNAVSAVDRLYQAGVRIVLLDDVEGAGKTTLAALFAKSHPDRAISLFVRPTSYWGTDIGYISRDLAAQLHWAVHNTELPSDAAITSADLRNYFFALQRFAKSSPYYIVVDGLDDARSLDKSRRDAILQLLPFGFEGFRFLLSQSPDASLDVLHDSARPYTLAGFTPQETKQYLGSSGLLDSEIEEVFLITHGLPGKLADLRRLLLTSPSTSGIRKDLPAHLANLLPLEWEAVDLTDALQVRLLALVAFEGSSSVAALMRRTSCNEQDIQNKLLNLSFIAPSATDDSLRFVTESVRAYAQSQLRDAKRDVYNIIIDDLIASPRTEASLLQLPTYLHSAGRSRELLDYLSPEFFSAAAERCSSLTPLRESLQLGLHAAESENNEAAYLRCALHSSALTGFDSSNPWRAEIRALVAVGRYADALSIAQSAPLIEDRLHLFAVLTRALHEAEQPLESSLVSTIQQLCEQVNQASLGDRISDIAGDLVFAMPEEAARLVGPAHFAGNTEASDWSLVSLSLHAQSDDAPDTGRKNSSAFSIQQYIIDPQVRSFSAALPLVFKSYSARDVIDAVSALPHVRLAVYLLQQWTRRNKLRHDAGQVIQYALQLAVSTTSYSLTATDVRHLCAPLPHLSADSATPLIAAVDGLRGVLEKNGPTLDYVRLQLTIAQSEFANADESSGTTRVVNVLLGCCAVADLTLRAECTSSIIAFCARLPQSAKLERDEGIRATAEFEWRAAISTLLADGAAHDVIIRQCVRILATDCPELVVEMMALLNTAGRKSEVAAEACRALCRPRGSRLPLPQIYKFLDLVTDDREADRIVGRIARVVNEEGGGIIGVADVEALCARIAKLKEPGRKAYALACIYAWNASENVGDTVLLERLQGELSDVLESIDAGWERLRNHFESAALLGHVAPQSAALFLERAKALKQSVGIASSTSITGLTLLIRLAISAVSGLLPQRLETERDVARIGELIGLIPSYVDRALLWGDLAQRYVRLGRKAESEGIVVTRIRPLLHGLPSHERGRAEDLQVFLAPILYSANPILSLEAVSRLPVRVRDAAIGMVCRFLLTKETAFEPYDMAKVRLQGAEYDDIVLAINLLKQIESDLAIYRVIRWISVAVHDDKRKLRFSNEQRQDLAARIEGVIATKLPSPGGITHDGFAVASLAQVARIRGAKNAVWESLVERGRLVPNAADRAYVLTILVEVIPNNCSALRARVIGEAEALITMLPSVHDRVTRANWLAEVLPLEERKRCREHLARAMELSREVNEDDREELQRQIVDFAHRVDPELARGMVEAFDDQPVKRSLTGRLDELRAQKAVLERDEGELQAAQAKTVAQGAWQALGMLHAGRLPPCSIDQLRRYTAMAASLPIDQAYPLFAWVLANLTLQYEHTSNASRFLRPMFDSVMLGCEVAARLASKAAEVVSQTRDRGSQILAEGQGVTFVPEDREKAIAFIRDWIAEHVVEYLKICDQFFGADDLDVLIPLRALPFPVDVTILTGVKGCAGPISQIEERFRERWDEVSALEPPQTQVIVIATRDEHQRFPIHDRWWLTKGAGLRLGTSINSLGVTQISEISVFTANDVGTREGEVDRLIRRATREIRGAKVDYRAFTL